MTSKSSLASRGIKPKSNGPRSVPRSNAVTAGRAPPAAKQLVTGKASGSLVQPQIRTLSTKPVGAPVAGRVSSGVVGGTGTRTAKPVTPKASLPALAFPPAFELELLVQELDQPGTEDRIRRVFDQAEKAHPGIAEWVFANEGEKASPLQALQFLQSSSRLRNTFFGQPLPDQVKDQLGAIFQEAAQAAGKSPGKISQYIDALHRYIQSSNGVPAADPSHEATQAAALWRKYRSGGSQALCKDLDFCAAMDGFCKKMVEIHNNSKASTKASPTTAAVVRPITSSGQRKARTQVVPPTAGVRSNRSANLPTAVNATSVPSTNSSATPDISYVHNGIGPNPFADDDIATVRQPSSFSIPVFQVPPRNGMSPDPFATDVSQPVQAKLSPADDALIKDFFNTADRPKEALKLLKRIPKSACSDPRMSTALCGAAAMGSKALVKAILKKGVDANQPVMWKGAKMTPLAVATSYNKKEVTELLKKAGAK